MATRWLFRETFSAKLSPPTQSKVSRDCDGASPFCAHLLVSHCTRPLPSPACRISATYGPPACSHRRDTKARSAKVAREQARILPFRLLETRRASQVTRASVVRRRSLNKQSATLPSHSCQSNETSGGEESQVKKMHCRQGRATTLIKHCVARLVRLRVCLAVHVLTRKAREAHIACFHGVNTSQI